MIDDAKIIDDLFGRDLDDRLARIHKRLDPPMCQFAVSEIVDNTNYQSMVVRERGTGQDEAHLLCYIHPEGEGRVRQPGVYRMIGRTSVSSKEQKKTILVIDAQEPQLDAPIMPGNCIEPPENYDADSLLHWFYDTVDMLALKHTGIYGQTLLHAAMALLFLSPQRIPVGEFKRIESGRLDLAIVGPTRTGKTTVVREVARAFGHDGIDLADSTVDGANASIVGLTAGQAKMGTRTYIKPGVFPRNHGGYVFLDEQQELARKLPAAMSELNGVRSPGSTSSHKIDTGRFPAEVRFASIMNPPAGMKHRMVEAILTTYPEEEARARTDLVVIAPNVSFEEQQQHQKT